MNAITVEDVSKRYIIRHERRHDTLRDALTSRAGALWRRAQGGAQRPGTEEFWALRKVSFAVEPGEVVGIIGRNGAGKSTLLKILSRITEATTGRIRLRGRVASLLEVGTGFHPELTGRENIFLNGAILGMRRAEIRRKFDDIVAFAEIERFLDTPVKRYSSGMYVRLAFAVAAHLEPEILIVDEVLAVGDASFQQKCLGKMREVSTQDGRTVLFVSHQLPAVRQLCRKSILLEQGQIRAHGSTDEVIAAYTGAAGGNNHQIALPPLQPGAKIPGITAAISEDLQGVATSQFRIGQMWRIRIQFFVPEPLDKAVVAIGLTSVEGVPTQTAWSTPGPIQAGTHEALFEQNVALEAGIYSVFASLTDREHCHQYIEAARIELTPEDPIGYFPRTSGVGTVLNSMRVEIQKL